MSEELEDDTLVFPNWKKSRMREIHEAAKGLSEDKRRLGPLEPYILLHSEIREEAALISRRLSDYHVIFVTGVSTDIVAVSPKKKTEFGTLAEQEHASGKMGFSFYSDNNAFSSRLLGLEHRLEDGFEKLDKSAFPDAVDKPRLYVVVGPFIAMGYYSDGGFRDLLLDDLPSEDGAVTNIAQTVDAILADKGKHELGQMEKYRDPSFQKMHYRFSEAFFDGRKASRVLELPKGMSPSDFRKACAEHTFYNRLIASYMYKSLLGMMPHQQEFLVIASESSYAMSIMERALKMADKSRVPLKVMEGTMIPLDGEANKTVMNRVGGYIQGQQAGRRNRMTLSEFFK